MKIKIKSILIKGGVSTKMHIPSHFNLLVQILHYLGYDSKVISKYGTLEFTKDNTLQNGNDAIYFFFLNGNRCP